MLNSRCKESKGLFTNPKPQNNDSRLRFHSCLLTSNSKNKMKSHTTREDKKENVTTSMLVWRCPPRSRHLGQCWSRRFSAGNHTNKECNSFRDKRKRHIFFACWQYTKHCLSMHSFAFVMSLFVQGQPACMHVWCEIAGYMWSAVSCQVFSTKRSHRWSFPSHVQASRHFTKWSIHCWFDAKLPYPRLFFLYLLLLFFVVCPN